MSLGSKFLRRSMLALVALGSSLALQPVAADILRYQGSEWGSVTTSGLSNEPSPPLPSPITSQPNAGAFSMRNLTAGGSFAAWCVDITTWLNTSNSGASYTLTSGANFYSSSTRGAEIVADLGRLASQHLASVNTRSESGAFQLAMWEIVYENSETYGLGSGNFRVSSASNGARSLANSWLSNLGDGTPTMTLSVWASSNSQDLAVFNVTPIPEPEIYAMLAAGLGILGFVGRRRRQTRIDA